MLDEGCNFLDPRVSDCDKIFDANFEMIRVLERYEGTIEMEWLHMVILAGLGLLVPLTAEEIDDSNVFVEILAKPMDIYDNLLCPMGETCNKI